MPDVLAELQVTLARQGRVGDRDTGPKPERYGLPIHLGAFDALSRADVLLGYWSSWVARKTHTARGGRGRAPQIKLLLANVNWIAQQDHAPRFVDDLVRWHRTSLALVDLAPDRWYAGPCPGCGRDQYVKRSLTHILCLCGELTDVAERREQLLAKVADHLATTTEIARALSTLATPVTPSQIRGWVHRGRLSPHGRNRERRPLYRLGDVLDLALGREHARH